MARFDISQADAMRQVSQNLISSVDGIDHSLLRILKRR